ncbi:MAG: Fic family protein [bacterium]|nr:Fic family protein [bacterium]
MKRERQGRLHTTLTLGEAVEAFVPSPLPPSPSIDWTTELQVQFAKANRALGGLDQVSSLLPNPALFIYTYIRKEAVLSSQIEGTQSSLSDLLSYEAGGHPGVPLDDVEEVSCYVAALNHGLERIRSGFPLSNRLFKEIHRKLLGSGRGSNKLPGEFRRSQNWIGGTRPGNAHFVPPPPEALAECMGGLEKFLHGEPAQTPTLVKAALVHLQFETIHPFLDGNGRLGRLLITLLLCAEGVLKEPLLYLSLFFKTHRTTYYQMLDQVRQDGDWEAWLSFFAEAVTSTAEQATTTARALFMLVDKHQEQILLARPKMKNSLSLLFPIIARKLVVTSESLVNDSELTPATVNACLRALTEQGIIEETTGKKRGRVFCYTACLELLDRGLEK